MIKRLSEMTAQYIVRDDAAADYEILAYGYELIYQEIVIILLSLLLALPFGLLPHVLTGICTFHLLRKYAGGSHAAHRIVCTIVSTAIVYGPSFFFVKTGVRLSFAVYMVMFAVDLLLLLLYAPADTEVKPVQTIEKRNYLKRASIFVLIALFVAACLLSGRFPQYAAIIAVTATLVCLFTHPLIYRLLGCKKSTSLEVDT